MNRSGIHTRVVLNFYAALADDQFTSILIPQSFSRHTHDRFQKPIPTRVFLFGTAVSQPSAPYFGARQSNNC